MKSCVIPVYFRMSQNYTLDGYLVPKARQTIYVVNAESERDRIVCPLRFRGHKNICYCRGVRMKTSWNRILLRTVHKFREDEYKSYGIYRFHSYYRGE